MSSDSAGTVAANGSRSRSLRGLASWVGNFGWPILLRELRADFRKNRFLLTHSLCLCILGTVVLILIASGVEDSTKTPSQMGRQLFETFFIVQYLVILVVFPAFSATTFAEERNRFTLDLLLTTTMRPRELVWGKFLAATVYCLLYVLASIPLMAVAFLFGGITILEVFTAYALLLCQTLLVSMLGVCVSSCLANSLRSTLVMYVLVFALLTFSWLFYTEAGLGGDQARLVVRVVLDDVLGWGRAIDGKSGFVVSFLAWAGILAALFTFMFLITANRIRPPADNKATGLRVLTLVAAPSVLGALAWSRWVGAPTAASSPDYVVVEIAAMVMLLIAWIFPTEEASVSRRNQRTFSRWTRLRYPFRIFAPGAFWGFAYSTVATLIICGGLYFVWVGFADSSNPSESRIVEQCLLTLPFFLTAVSAAGFFLAACDFSPLYARLTVIFVFVITLLLPVIFALSEQPDAIWTFYYLSPITLWFSLDPDPPADSGITYELFDLPIIHVAKAVYAGLTCLFLFGGVHYCRRAGYPLFRFGDWSKAPRRGTPTS